MKGWERAINALSVRRPQPNNINPRMKEEKGKNIRRQKVSKHLGQLKGISLALETRQSHTI